MPGVAISRAAGLLMFWLMLAGAHPADLPVGVIAAALGAWASLRLLPPGRWRLSPLGIARLAWRFPRQSALAGWDVARRAFDPKLPLRPGFVTWQPTLPPGTAREAFCAFISLLPGSVPVGNISVGTDGGLALVVHCVDLGQPVAAQLATEEKLFARAVGLAGEHA
jgi:multicomponent Na+:H+ antiporter subunit E